MVGRVTRKKAAEIAEQLHVDEDAVLGMNTDEAALRAKVTTPDQAGRAPLGELEPNSAESKVVEEEPVEELKKSTRSRKAGKKGGAKGKKNNLAASTATPPDGADVLPDDNESAPSPASEEAAEESSPHEAAVGVPTSTTSNRSQSPPSAAVRLTRSQLARKADIEANAESTEAEEDGFGEAVSHNDNPTIETLPPTYMSETAITTETAIATETALDAPASPLSSAVPKVIKNLRSETPGKRSTSNKENVEPEAETASMASPRPQTSMYDALEDAVVAAATPPRAETQASPRTQDPIAALDELEDLVESVSKDIPEIQASPQKLKPRVDEHVAPAAAEEVPVASEKKPEAKRKAAPVVRTTKAAQARLSMAQNKDTTGKPPSFGRPRPSTTLGRSSSVRQSVAPKSTVTTSKRVTSNPTTARSTSLQKSTTTAPAPPREKKEAVIPHSKPRPISLSFPTPPPPPKSTKAATQSSFQLPGEAVAAKLKAAREARLARETAAGVKREEKKPAFKARPVPKAPTAGPAVRQTNASRARESVLPAAGNPAPIVQHKRSNTVGATRTVSSSSTTANPAPRPSTSLAPALKPRVPSNGTAKGKEVFARAANTQAAAEREKGEKEAAAKRARAEAAERGRVASREWAERQKARKMRAAAAAARVVKEGGEGGEGEVKV